jgi:GNAT superfamily N-acetyltransferase
MSHATMGDLELLSDHRQKMWLEIFPGIETKVNEISAATKSWIESKLSEGRLVGFIVKTPEGKVAGSGCVWVRDEVPRPNYSRKVVPYLMSMYTEIEFRRMGVAKMIVEAAIKWCRANGYERVLLHASDAGKPLYESLGFEPTREMRLNL